MLLFAPQKAVHTQSRAPAAAVAQQSLVNPRYITTLRRFWYSKRAIVHRCGLAGFDTTSPRLSEDCCVRTVISLRTQPTHISNTYSRSDTVLDAIAVTTVSICFCSSQRSKAPNAVEHLWGTSCYRAHRRAHFAARRRIAGILLHSQTLLEHRPYPGRKQLQLAIADQHVRRSALKDGAANMYN